MGQVTESVKARGVVPKRTREESVIRNPDASGWFVFIDLAESIDLTSATAFLRQLHEEADALRALRDEHSGPVSATGQDALISRGLVAFEKAGFYFVLPEGPDFVGQKMFAPVETEKMPKHGRLALRKRLVDANGIEVQADLRGFKFRVTDSTGNVAAELVTNAAGHAQSDALATGATYRIEEVELPPNITSDPIQEVLRCRARSSASRESRSARKPVRTSVVLDETVFAGSGA